MTRWSIYFSRHFIFCCLGLLLEYLSYLSEIVFHVFPYLHISTAFNTFEKKSIFLTLEMKLKKKENNNNNNKKTKQKETKTKVKKSFELELVTR